MKLTKFSASLASLFLTLSGTVGMTMLAASTPLIDPAQAQSAGQAVNTLRGCFINTSFTAKVAFNPTNIRQQPTIASNLAPTKLTQVGAPIGISGFVLGQAIPDAWDGQLDNMWYRLADGRGYVASAVVNGYPPRGTCTTNGKAENFFRVMVGVQGVTRYDRNDLNGQCVTLAVRYLQDVYFGASNAPRAYGHGKDVARGVASQHPNLFQYKTSGTPKRGAIISFQGGIYDATYGHVGIVLDTNANGDFTMLESNYDGRATQSIVRVSPWRNRANVVGWADPVGNLP